MERRSQTADVVAELDLAGCPPGPVLEPMQPRTDVDREYFGQWDTPLATWGGFGLHSGLSIHQDGSQTVLELNSGNHHGRARSQERSLVCLRRTDRDYAVEARLRPIDSKSAPHNDRADCALAYVGVVFRVRDSRHFYLFCLEGKRQAVLYRRSDDEWRVLAESAVTIAEGYVTLHVSLDGDGIRCACDDLGVAFDVTDTTYRTGRAGVRAVGHARVASIRVLEESSQSARNRRITRLHQERVERLGEGIPDPVLVRTIDLQHLGTVPRKGLTYAPSGEPFFCDYAVPGRYDMLVAGETLRGMTVEGDLLWELSERVDRLDSWPDQRLGVYSREHTDEGRFIYLMRGERARNPSRRSDGLEGEWVINHEMLIIAGATGEVVASARLPRMDDALRFADYSRSSANLTGSGRDIVVREWRRDAGGSGFRLWAYDEHLNPLWTSRTRVAYGHHEGLMACDVTGNGRDEILAGGTLFDATGQVLWEHDRIDEVARIAGAEHYDSVIVGHLSGDPAVDPVAFLLAGSAGVYVVDALTGATRMTHRVGHAQFRSVGRLRTDYPGMQVLVANRWGNMGILTLFSGHGDRLWTIQPDYIGEGSRPVRWGDGETDLIWANTSGPVQAFYDGYGRLVKRLPQLSRLWGQRMRKHVQRSVERMGADPRDLLALTVDDVLYAFGPS